MFTQHTRMSTPDSHVTIMFITTKNLGKCHPSHAFGAKITALLEHLANDWDYNYNEVHAEIILDRTAYSAVGLPPEPCVLTYSLDPAQLTLPCIEYVHIPLTDIQKAKDFLSAASKTQATYDVSVQDFCLPDFVLNYTDPELDCSAPMSWTHLYCSQFALLFLRYCHAKKIIPLPEDRLRLLWSSSSHKWSPAHLKRMLDTILIES